MRNAPSIPSDTREFCAFIAGACFAFGFRSPVKSYDYSASASFINGFAFGERTKELQRVPQN